MIVVGWIISFLIGALTSTIVALFYGMARRPNLLIVVGSKTSPDDPYRFLHVDVINSPYGKWMSFFVTREIASFCRIRITITDTQRNKSVIFNGRWTSKREPGTYVPGGLLPDLGEIHVIAREDIPPGESVEASIAVKHRGEVVCYGFNNESYMHTGWRDPVKEFGIGNHEVRVEVISSGQVFVRYFRLINPSNNLADFDLVLA